ncbi:glycine-rich domain-containing protein [Shewanella xiamenensis]|uniref:glycine-rich domain-containing protein n=1 Tax=Shewanella xiamenensis TaxID=332186 RepID=UPI000849D889|nr:hypothetical protein [Shewanella xiamenensis]ODR86700.1 hypothetical protein ABT47_15995 [Shewanella xiamenensis]
MHQIDNAFTSQVMPPMEQSGEPGWFHGGGGGTRPTPVGRDWYNMVQAEFLAILSAGNIAPNKAKLNQLAQAIKTIAGSISDKAFESHLSAADPHHMYVKKDSYQEEMAQAISQAVSQHEQKQDPHPQYLTADEGAEQVSQGVSQHEQKQNPHPQYLTADEGAEQVNQGVSQHEQKQDPHPQYLTADEGAEQVNQGVAQHEKKQDPHPQYVNAAGLEFAANAAALQKIEQHKQESDPHPQYFTQEEVQSAIAEALANQPRLGVDVQVFTESGTYVKPKGAKSISVLLIAGGGAGQRGNTAATGAVTGGWSGAGGSVFMGTFPADIASDNHAVIVGHGGVGSYVNPINNNDEGQPSEIVGLFVAPAGSVYASSTDTLASDTPAMYPGMQPLTSNANGAMQSPYSGDKIKKMVLTGMPAGVPGEALVVVGLLSHLSPTEPLPLDMLGFTFMVQAA